ncbi:transcription factor CPC-like [Coffea eugenioides]|uniref:Transcription factor CPC n=1 Tax=Coffea arabica TaxID=13443 RepID=A0A6P6UCZ6_COFAR|nr:transcription factor CPC-like [Coffea arabica]XP_027185716.1 transcription factor CPC-like [Coffea eugenioides]
MADSHRTRVDGNDKVEKEGTIKRRESKPEFSEDEEMLMARMYRLVGPRWALIAGRIPGRTPQEMEKYFTSKNASTSN